MLIDLCELSPSYVRSIAPYQPGKPISELAREMGLDAARVLVRRELEDRKSTRLNSSHLVISYAVFCLKKKNQRISVRCCGPTSDPPASPHPTKHLEVPQGPEQRSMQSSVTSQPSPRRLRTACIPKSYP